MPRLSKKATDSIFILVPIWLSSVKGIIFLPIILSAISLDTYGTYVQIMANVILLTPLTHWALGQAIVRYGSKLDDSRRDELREVLWSPVLFCLFSALIVITIYLLAVPALSRIFLQDYSESSQAIVAPLILMNGLSVILIPYLNSRQRFKEAGIFRMLRDFIPYVGMVVGLSLYGDLFIGLLILVILTSVVTAIMLVKVLREVGLPAFKFKTVFQYLRFSWPIATTNFAQINLEVMPKYFILGIIGPSALGIYNIIYILAKLLSTAREPFVKYLNSSLPKIWDLGNTRGVLSTIERCSVYYIAIVIAGSLILIFSLEAIISMFLPSVDLSILPEHRITVTFLCMFGLFFGLNDFARIIAKLRHRPKVILITGVLGYGITIPITYFAVKYAGVLGAAIGQCVSVILVQILLTRMLVIHKTSNFYKSIIKLSVPAILASLPLIFIPAEEPVPLLASMLIAMILYVFTIHQLRIITTEEISKLVFQKHESD